MVKLQMHTVKFKVVTISQNRNSFGLYGVIIIDRDGHAWQIGVNYINLPKKGDVVNAWVSSKTNDLYRIAEISYEIPQQLDKAPPPVVKEVWSENFAKQTLKTEEAI